MSFFTAKELKVGYQKQVVVDDVNIDLHKGEILCLLGPNGCGKSTILKTITDHIRLLEGSITVLGKDLNLLSNKQRAKEMSVVLTERIAPELMTAEEVVAIGRYPYTNHFGKLGEEDKKVIDEAIQIVHGENLRDKVFQSLSDGEKQRIMLARAICQEADIMVLDEPTSFLDIRFKIELLNILRTLSLEKNKTIIMSLHEIDLVSKIADKVLLIRSGKVFKYGAPEDVITDESIKEAYELYCGYFNTNIGNIELPKGIDEPEIFVISGGGAGTKIFRALHKKGFSFYSGILFKNDIDFNTSNALAYETIVEDDFLDIGKENFEKSKEFIKRSKLVIDSGVSLAGINEANFNLLKFAEEQKIEILSLRDEEIGVKAARFTSISMLLERISEIRKKS